MTYLRILAVVSGFAFAMAIIVIPSVALIEKAIYVSVETPSSPRSYAWGIAPAAWAIVSFSALIWVSGALGLTEP